MKRKERPSAAAIKRAEKDDLVERLKLSHAMVQLVDNEGNTTGPVRPSFTARCGPGSTRASPSA